VGRYDNIPFILIFAIQEVACKTLTSNGLYCIWIIYYIIWL